MTAQVKEPGDLRALSERGAEAWADIVSDALAGAARQIGDERHLLAPAEEAAGITLTDWTGFPTRVASCLTRRHALELLDWRNGAGFGGGRLLQEEYVEWRAVHDAHGIRRVELTTELSAYWSVLAAYEPEEVLRLVANFADESSVDTSEVFGSCDPFDPNVTPEERQEAFAATMLPPHGTSPYNNGERAICCMVQPSNTLAALAWLAAAATTRRVVRDSVGEYLRCLTCTEVIPLLAGAAQDGRASDPVLVERLGRLAFEGRRVAFAEPVGVYIHGFELARLTTPDGEAVPTEWISLSRGVNASESTDGRSRFQRLVLEVPSEVGSCVSDLIDLATERPIRFGGEVADLVQLVSFFRVSDRGVVPSPSEEPLELNGAERPDGCTDVRKLIAQFDAARERLRGA